MAYYMVKQVYFKGVKFSGYSNWHRQQHNLLHFSDIDQVSSCNACLKPLFIAETVFDNNQGWNKPHKVTKELADMAGLPAFIVWYKLVEDQMVYVHIKKIAPDYKDGFTSDPIKLLPDEWLQFLEHKQVEHYQNCNNKTLFLKKLNEDPIAKTRKAYASILY
jgi:hypothetical protein